MPQINLKNIRASLHSHASPTKAKILQGFFKTGVGQYGEGDVFIGVTVPILRNLAKEYISLCDNDIELLIHSRIHEERMLGLMILTYQVEKANKTDSKRKKAIVKLYIKNRIGVNNWDLVDLSCYKILGAGAGYAILKKLKSWAISQKSTLWEKRIAMVSTLYFIRLKDPLPTLTFAKILLKEKHDLLQKAVGWMLREVGKYCSRPILEKFLKQNYKTMGRTALRYAIEHFTEAQRKRYLKGLI